ncbi:Dual-specificity RNA methyltransferase [Frankliniella fusca]|uniref:Dual-specificity RNA methyltransferase n=1 Tax=Frankliniella fusca TaxID=407009 RepID=A0AAE1HE31_9NEOP|nr:Dual-specificity RNA methyltransferase [Frankliniella fusca]
MRYTSVLSDGDATTIAHLNEIKTYGDDIIIEKEECVNHVGKRLGTALRNLVKEEKARGVTLEGKKAGALKDTAIVRLQSFNQKAIKSTLPDIPRAQKEINATLDHMNSTDKKPKHNKCPKDVESWCFYNKAKAKKEKPKSHQQMSVSLNDEVFHKVKPIYKRMSEKELLERCVRRRYELAATRGVREFNMGLASMASIRKSGRLSTQIAEKVDARREDQSSRQEERTKTRAKKKADRKKTDKKNETKEGPTYAPRAF